MSAPPSPPDRGPGSGGTGSVPEESLPRQLTGVRSPLVWGIILLVVIEGTVLSLFVVSYFYLRMGTPEWPPLGVPLPDLLLPTVALLLVLASPVPLWLGIRSLVRDRMGPFLLGLPVGLLLAFGYLAATIASYLDREYHWTSHAYGSLDWSMSAYAGLHVVVLLLAGGFAWVLGMRGHFGGHRYTGLQALLIYWIFVALGALLFYGIQYLTPHV